MATPKQAKISAFFAVQNKTQDENSPVGLTKETELDKENMGKRKKTSNQDTKAVKKLKSDEPAAKKDDVSVLTSSPDESVKDAATPETPHPAISVDSTPVVLSPEAKDRMARNQAAAKLKLLGTTTKGLVADFGPSWLPALEPEFSKGYFVKLAEFVAAERSSKTVYPPAKDVFSWTRLCPIDKIKVVILGQDPYHGPDQAHGLCFSVQKGVPPPPSLVNMYKELEKDIDGFRRPEHGYLGGWAEQGVLLLNACLTVRRGEANSHKDKGWETFTDAVIKKLSETRPPGLVFVLWGGYAQKKGKVINRTRPGHHVLSGAHPSPLSAHRGFFGCRHFSKVNELLEKEGVQPVDWTKLPEP